MEHSKTSAKGEITAIHEYIKKKKKISNQQPNFTTQRTRKRKN